MNDKGQNELDPTHKEWNNVNQMIETVEMANNLVNLRKAATGAGTNHGSTSMKRIAANEVSTLDNLFKSRPILPEYIVNHWTKNITIEEDSWIYTNIAYKLQALGYKVPPDKIYKNKADLLAICG